MKSYQLAACLAVIAAAPSMAADVTWTLTGPTSVDLGQPVSWQASVAVTGANQGLAGYAFHVVIGPGAGPTAGGDGQWGTNDDENLADVQLAPAAFVNSFQVAGSSPPPGSLSSTYSAGGPGMNVLAQTGSNTINGELLQVGTSYLAWAAAPGSDGQTAGVGIAGLKSGLLANPAGEYVVNSGTIPTTGLAPGSYTVMLIPVATRTLRDTLDFSQDHAGFIMQSTTSSGSSFSFFLGMVDIPGDFDEDHDVDLDDLVIFSTCFGGPDVPYNPVSLPGGCDLPVDGNSHIEADFDGDGDVDHGDFGVFQRCISGANMPGDPNCAN